jgi:release factor glutamine methyltransferase
VRDRLTVGELLTQITARFEQAGIPTPAVDAEWLVRHVTRWSRTRLVINSGSHVGDDVLAALEPLVIRRAGREPLQLIVGSVGFRYLDIEVRPGVFIPRPETEVLAGEAIARVPEGGVVVEPCTGTGAIACAVAQETNAATVIATDISDAAVELAAANAKRADLPVTVLGGDLLAPVDPALRGGVDLLVSNPPYLTPDDLEGREPEVLDWDPLEALVAGPSGHEVTDRLIAAALDWLRPGGWLLLEVDAARAAETAARAAGAGLRDTRVLHDLTGTDRIVIARHP